MHSSGSIPGCHFLKLARQQKQNSINSILCPRHAGPAIETGPLQESGGVHDFHVFRPPRHLQALLSLACTRYEANLLVGQLDSQHANWLLTKLLSKSAYALSMHVQGVMAERDRPNHGPCAMKLACTAHGIMSTTAH